MSNQLSSILLEFYLVFLCLQFNKVFPIKVKETIPTKVIIINAIKNSKPGMLKGRYLIRIDTSRY